ncbi:MAG: ribosome-associated translation inhibitor RaiA [Eubacteriales bacterium]|nr:ribosome-associated translation inhibitor RaiA [Eubacteriales bacterium]MDD3074065.1 ribosome-associated translation inhibitor RaiA [Eubacteriales bacterium]MDD4078782.1 ribosome-associated translation inhibitor RaiA [Eubacteriales bacterium]MDD4769021.1 ribosome-associated translation inhibitor RaiA [Eubacteriales bacterium]
MRIITRGKNIEVTDALKTHVEKRIGKISKYFDEDTEAQVTLSVVKDTHVVDATLLLKGGMLVRGEVQSPDMYASIDLVTEKLERQIRKYKTRINRKARQLGPNGDEGRYLEDEPKIVRTKRFAIKPMLPDEAVLQMNLLEHDFFMFINAETNMANVVYRRKDGNFGLIEPQD